MADGRPSERGFFEIADDAGSVVTDVNRLRLGPGLSLSHNPFDPSAVIDIIGELTGQIVQVDKMSDLRGYSSLLMLNGGLYRTRGYQSANDGGDSFYRWDSSSTAVDDGFLVIKLASRTTGRMKFVNVGNDTMFNVLRIGPALADLGSRTVSFDPNGAVAIGSELYRVSKILRNAGWEGMFFPNGRYKVNGLDSEKIAPSSAKGVSFRLKAASGAELFGDPANTTSYNAGIGIYAEGEVDFLGTPYNGRYWTQTINGGENVFGPGISSTSGISVGDVMLCRFGAEITDFSGYWASYSYGEITDIDSGTGTVTTYQVAPEKCPADPGHVNPYRQHDKHDMIKIVGFQDNTTIEGFLITDVFFGNFFARNLTINCTWLSTKGFCVNTGGGIGMDLSIRVHKGVGSSVVPGGIITLASQYGTHIRSIVCNDVVPSSGAICNIVSEESSCRGTSIDHMDLTVKSSNAFNNTIVLVGQTPGQNNAIRIGLCVIKGIIKGVIADNVCIDVLDIRCLGGLTQDLAFGVDQIGTLIYNGVLYRNKVTRDYFLPFGNSTKTINIPFHGLTGQLRLKPSSMTGVTSVAISGDGFVSPTDITGSLTAGSWSSIGTARVPSISTPNFPGNNAMSIRVTGSGTTPAGSYIAIEHTCFEPYLDQSALSSIDTSVPRIIVTNGAPSSDATFIGQACFDSSNSNWYDAINTGTGSSDWKLRGGSAGALLSSNNLSDVASTSVARANLGVQPLDIIDSSTLSAASDFASSAWAVGKYEKIIVEFNGQLSAASSLELRANLDNGLNYSDFATVNVNGIVSPDNSAKGSLTAARFGGSNASSSECAVTATFWPLTTGRERVGICQSTSITTAGTAATSTDRKGGFCWHNTATDVTAIYVLVSTGSMTGTIKIWGVPA